MTTHEKQATEKENSSSRQISRRRFLEIAGAAAAGLLISSCSPSPEPAEPASAEVAPTKAPTAAPPTATEAAPTVAPTATPPPTVAPTGLSSQVAIARVEDYDRDRIYNVMRDMLDDLGGLSDVVRPGDRVAIKTNLTGGLGNEGPPGFSPMESFVTHPEVVRALGALALDAGAKEVLIVEAVYQWGSYSEWGYEEAAEDIGATLVDLNATDPYDEFVDAQVPGGGEMYETYILNPILQEIDVFMSAAKMKCHLTAGVTHSLKNLFGLVPARFYRLSQQHSHRSEFHGPTAETAGTRVPRIIVELNKTRPIDFALIDGVLTTEGGEGPWVRDFGPIAPGLLFAGKDPVAADAVATAAQGFDPTAPGYTEPFVRAENHLNLAVDAGLGTNRLDEIEVFGPSIDEVKRDFKVSYS
ncbi:MAG: DUF362 domain-containing protein [Anaerolineae bacterium]